MHRRFAQRNTFPPNMPHLCGLDSVDPFARKLKLEGASFSFKCCATMSASTRINTGGPFGDAAQPQAAQL